jgi:hypothetical protein
MWRDGEPSRLEGRRELLARLMRLTVAAGVVAGLALWSEPARAQTATLGASDFALVLSRVAPSSGDFTPLDDGGRAGFFSAARCACPGSFGVTLALTSDGAAKLAVGDTLDATVMIGSDCDSVSATACPSFGSSLTLNADQTTTEETLPTSVVFGALAPGAGCGALPSSSSRLWAIVRLNGTRLETQPSVTLGLGGTAAPPPTSVAALTADGGLLVSWTAPATTTLRGYQLFCSPGPAQPPAARFDNCPAAPSTGGTGPFAALDATLLCSDLVPAGTNSVRLHGLQNGTTYQVAVVSIGGDGMAGAPSAIAEATPGPTLGFDDVYKQEGGTGLGGCAIGGGVHAHGRELVGLAVGLALFLLVARRRGRDRRGKGRAGALPLVLALVVWATEARAGDDATGWNPPAPGLTWGEASPPPESPRAWNLELRFGPYYPDVDSELADRGQTARPFEEVFSSKKRLMAGLELDRQLSRRGGTWALGVAAGYYKATASALAADHVTRTGDETSLRIIPLSVLAVYRADPLRRLGSPLVPYAKLGLGCAVWTVGGTAKGSSEWGRTLGWNAAAGVSLDLTSIDPDGARAMDVETGINQFAVFVEVARAAYDGFGSSSVLRVGDTTWLAGLMLEM